MSRYTAVCDFDKGNGESGPGTVEVMAENSLINEIFTEIFHLRILSLSTILAVIQGKIYLSQYKDCPTGKMSPVRIEGYLKR